MSTSSYGIADIVHLISIAGDVYSEYKSTMKVLEVCKEIEEFNCYLDDVLEDISLRTSVPSAPSLAQASYLSTNHGHLCCISWEPNIDASATLAEQNLLSTLEKWTCHNCSVSPIIAPSASQSLGWNNTKIPDGTRHLNDNLHHWNLPSDSLSWLMLYSFESILKFVYNLHLNQLFLTSTQEMQQENTTTEWIAAIDEANLRNHIKKEEPSVLRQTSVLGKNMRREENDAGYSIVFGAANIVISA
ncbi:hypothetical protein F5884DRAFT_380218 [Xylogone sp. PMI_703]|nr:hypothetical protein F5884DRAFT_380218 [Xylogone sp. PMI_703]